MPILKLRKVLGFNTLLGLTFPKEYTNALGLTRGDYAEIHLTNKKTIVVMKHEVPLKKIKVTD